MDSITTESRLRGLEARVGELEGRIKNQLLASTALGPASAIRATSQYCSSTIDEFCERHRFSRATFYNLRRAGRAPTVKKIGTRSIITNEAEAEWLKALAQETAAAAIAG
jgi:predicted DNA-binding transcriptional regulator AlpA